MQRFCGLRGLLPVLAAAIASACTGAGAPPTACAGLSARTMAVTREEYAPCAGEMLAALDTLERALQRGIVGGQEEAFGDARRVHRRLRALIREVDFRGDYLREMREGASRTVQRWPEDAMRMFNGELGNALAQYSSALGYPNVENLEEGRRHHRLAAQAYDRFR